MEDFGGRSWTLGGFWGHFWGVLEGLWAPFLVSGQLLGALFLVLEAPWWTLWHQMAPRSDFLRFGMRFGVHLGRFWELLGVHFDAFATTLGDFGADFLDF